MPVDLKDYPSIDIMNHILEIRRDLAGNPFAFREFQIMLQTTFKKLTAKPPESRSKGTEEGRGKDKKKKSGGGGAGMLSGHASPAECVADMDELGYAHIAGELRRGR